VRISLSRVVVVTDDAVVLDGRPHKSRLFRLLDRQIAKFIVVGAIGFLTDGAVLSFLSVYLGLDVYLSRLFSFGVATLVTWFLNRRFTFFSDSSLDARARAKEYFRYVLVQTIGALINLGVFSALIKQYEVLRWWPLIPLAIGAIVALVFNFIGARVWVYPRRLEG